jgi:capsular exopolysaccharide synthesis family protein
VLAVSFLAGVGLALVVSYLAHPVYQAEATIMVTRGQASGGLAALSFGSFAERTTAINNQVEILGSRTLASQVLEKLLVKPGHESFRLFSGADGAPSADAIITSLRDNIDVAPMKDADFIVLRARGGSPAEAMTITNAYLDEYLAYSKLAARGEVGEVKTFLKGQLDAVELRLRAAEDALREYQKEHKVVGLPEETTALVEQISEFEGLLNQARTEHGMNQARLDYLKAQLREQMATLPEDIAQVSSPVIKELRSTLSQLEAARSQLLTSGYAPEHPKMAEVQEQIEDAKARLIQTTREAVATRLAPQDPLSFSQDLVDQILVLEVEVASNSARVVELDKVMAGYSVRFARLPSATLELARLERDKRANENIYTMLLETYEEARIAEARELGEVRVIDRAEQPLEPVSPNKKLNVIIGAILGLGVGLGLVFTREYLVDAVRFIEDVEKETSLPVLGIIPEFGKPSKTRDAAQPSRSIEDHLVTHQDPLSPVSEAYRTLRTNVGYAGQHGPPRSLLVTSPGPGEGKSTTVANLAITMAQQGTNVVLVDADLRRAVDHTIFGLSLEPGLSDLLAGRAGYDQVVRPTGVPNLSMVTSGATPPNPSELLGSYRMMDVIKELSTRFDCALFDAPPILLVTDAAVVAAKTEAALVVVCAGATRRSAVLRTKTLLETVRANIIGFVLNQVEREKGYGTYYHQYYRRYYGGPKSE